MSARTLLLLLALCASTPFALAKDVLLTMSAYGPVRIGMPVGEAHRLLRQTGRKHLPDPAKTARTGCDYFVASKRLSFMVQDGKIVRIETSEANVVTPFGIRVGSSIQVARRALGPRMAEDRQFYGRDEDRSLVLIGRDQRFAMRFEATERVGEILAGEASVIHRVEGCS